MSEEDDVIEPEQSKEPSKEDFNTLISDESSTEDKAPEIAPIESEEGEKEMIPELETKVIETPVAETKAELPEGLICPHCKAVARTEKSYLKNHGENCARKIETK